MTTLDLGGLRLNYELDGPSGAPVVVFSNSLGTTLSMWDGVLPSLRGRYRTLRYDTRGHGGSATVDAPVDVFDLAADLAGLLGGLGIARAHVVGLSLGGMTGQALAIRHPERVASLTLMATSAHMPTLEMWTERAALVRREGTAAIVDATLGRWLTPAAPAALVAAQRDKFVAVDPVGYAVCCGVVGALDLRPELRRIAAPTLVMAGRDDPATPVAMSEFLAAAIPDAELVVLPRAAHLLAVERPDAAAAHLLAFLDRHREAVRPARPATFDEGLANRKAVLGEAHVERSLAAARRFATPWQEAITRTAWGDVWGDPRLAWKTRSLVTLAMMVALNREDEFKLHVRPALANGVTPDELQALLLQSATYAGLPAANAAFRWVREVLGDDAEPPAGA